MKILSFTSNAYRGRLFASYILSMPTVIRWGWEAIVSKFVSENTLKKLKLTGDPWHEDMWTHISRAIVEQRYGGDMPNLVNNFWPPRQDFLLFTDPRAQSANNLITTEEYGNLWSQDKLLARKVLRKWVKEKEEEREKEGEVMPIREEGLRWTREATVLQETRF